MQLFHNVLKRTTVAFCQRTLNYRFHCKSKIHIHLIYHSNAMRTCICGKHIMITGSYSEKKKGASRLPRSPLVIIVEI